MSIDPDELVRKIEALPDDDVLIVAAVLEGLANWIDCGDKRPTDKRRLEVLHVIAHISEALSPLFSGDQAPTQSNPNLN